MGTSTPFIDPEQRQKGNALTTAEAKATKAPFLSLSSLKLTELPKGLDKLNSLTNLDISNNVITSLPENSLPPNLIELTLTGCQLTELPNSLGALPRLKKLFAGANRLTQVDAVFHSMSLQHVGLSYNRVSLLPPPEVLEGSSVLSLDLSHNDLEGLVVTLGQLSALPSLGALSLSGNPLALAPRYSMEVRARLKQLLFLDGQRLDLPANSRPGTANSGAGGSISGGSRNALQQVSQRLAAQTSTLTGAPLGGRSFGATSFSPHTTVRFEDADEAAGGERTALTLTLRGLQPAEDPFGWLKARWDEQISTATDLGMTVPPTLEIPVPPLQPVMYHIEMTDMEGTPLACIPLKVSPPTPPDVVVLFDPKAKAAAAAAAAKEAKEAKGAAKKSSKPNTPSKAKRGKAAAVVTEQSVQRELETGLLQVTLPIRAVVEHRNWLRSGTTVTMYKTTLTAVPKPPADPAEAAAAEARSTTPKAGGRKKKGDEPPPVEYDITSSTEVIGTAMLRAGAQVVDGNKTEGSERLDFVPPPPVFDERGIRLALKDPRHPSQPVGHVEAEVELHVRLPGWTAAGEG